MINLIGPVRKRQILAARRNSIWVRYNFLLFSTLAAITIILGGTAFFYYGQKLSQDATVLENKQKLTNTEYQKNKIEGESFRKNLKTAKTILDAETHYSIILLDVSKTMPPNTILRGIDFNNTTFESLQTLVFRSKTVDDAIALKSAFEKNPPLSSKVHFSIIEKTEQETDASTSSIEKKYPVSITMYKKQKKPSSSLGSTSSSGKNR